MSGLTDEDRQKASELSNTVNLDTICEQSKVDDFHSNTDDRGQPKAMLAQIQYTNDLKSMNPQQFDQI